MLSELLLDRNIFETEESDLTRKNILEMPIPDFRELRNGIDDKLNDIVKKALQRPRELRFQSANDMLTAFEVYLYSDGYGPTNEKLADYLQDLFAEGKAYLDDPKSIEDG